MDIRGYGRMLETRDNARNARLLRAFRGLVRKHAGAHRALRSEFAADTAHVVFRAPGDATSCALALADAIEGHSAKDPDIAIPVGFALHAGETHEDASGHVGPVLATLGDLLRDVPASHIYMTETVRALLRSLSDEAVRDLGARSARGARRGIRVYELIRANAPEVPERPPERRLATLFFTDLGDSTKRTVELGDHAWRDLLERHHAIVRAELERHGGTEVDTAGDGFFATFTMPSQAVSCAIAARDAIARIGLGIRIGVHIGECEIIAGKVGGLAVAVGGRIRDRAAPGEILVSEAVRQILSAAPIRFDDRGARPVKGAPGRWRLYAVGAADRSGV
jgi:class 3 adenylate cyclase